MGSLRINDVLEIVLPQSPLLGLLWAGLALLTLALIVLMFTRLGQIHPLRKCLALSLLAHLWLAGYSTTIKFGSTASVAEEEPAVRVALNDSATESIGPESGNPESTARKSVLPSGDKPWDSFGNSTVRQPEPVELARSDVKAPVDPPRRSAIEPSAVPRTGTLDHLPLARATVPEPASPTAPPTPLKADTSAEKIDAPAAQKRSEQRLAVKLPGSPGRADTSQAASSTATRASTAGLPSELFGQTLSLPRVAASRGAPDPGGLLKDIADRPSQPTTRAPANTAAESVAGPQPLDAGDAASADGAPSGSAERMVKANPLPAVNKGGPASGTTGKVVDSPSSMGPPLAILPRLPREPSDHQVPDAYKLRVAPNRAQLAERHGATTQTEAAVKLALKWLANAQGPDGRWRAAEYGGGREVRVAGRDRVGAGLEADNGMTGLALLALLAAGHTHRDGPHQDQVRRGLEYLLSTQGRDGSLGGRGTIFEFMYCHGIATFAMSEALGMSGDERLREPVRRALNYAIRAQNTASGGWRYQPGDPGDTSQLGWQYMALKSGELAGLPMPDATRKGVIKFLGSVAQGNHGGLASYRPYEKVTPAMTAEAIFCWQLLGMPRQHPAGREAGDYLLQELPGKGKPNLYYWYYGTLAMYQLQDLHWTRWNEALRSALLPTQIKEGPLAGSWEPDGVWGGYGGRVYSTALSALCLEVYYRFLPLYREAGTPETKVE